MASEEKTKRLSWMAVGIVVIVLAIDQIIKVCVKTNLCLHESVHVTDWFYISFVENNGMAYGMTIVPKLALSLFRIAAVALIGWYICRLIKQQARTLYIALMALIMAGASVLSYILAEGWADKAGAEAGKEQEEEEKEYSTSAIGFMADRIEDDGK